MTEKEALLKLRSLDPERYCRIFSASSLNRNGTFGQSIEVVVEPGFGEDVSRFFGLLEQCVTDIEGKIAGEKVAPLLQVEPMDLANGGFIKNALSHFKV